MTKMRLRPTRPEDMMMYFDWVNDPVVRKSAFQSEPIDLATHRAWFSQALADDYVRMWVLDVNGIAVGQVRLTFEEHASRPQRDFDRQVAFIDYSIASEQRRHGYGRRMLALVECEVPKGTILVGQVRKENLASRRTFLSLGYTEAHVGSDTFWEYRKQMV